MGVDHDAGDGGVILPFAELSGEQPHHVVRECVQGAGPVERDDAGDTFAVEQNFCFAGLLHENQLPSKSRLTITRMISLVPSRIW